MLEPGRAGDGLVHLVGQMFAEPLRVNIAGGAFQPDIEKVGKFGVVHIVVVGRVKDDGVHGIIGQIQILGVAVDYPGGGGQVVRRRRRRGRGKHSLLGFRLFAGGRAAIRGRPAGHCGQGGDTIPYAVNGPFQAQAANSDGHFGVRPLHSEVFAVEGMPNGSLVRYPSTKEGVIVKEFIRSQGNVAPSGLAGIVQAARGLIGIDQFPEGLDAVTMGQLLARRKHIAPWRHTVLQQSIGFVPGTDGFVGQDVLVVPLEFVQASLDVSHILVHRARQLKAADGFGPGGYLAGFVFQPIAVAIDDAVEAVAHSSGLGRLGQVAFGGGGAAVGPGAGGDALAHGAGGLVWGGGYYLELAGAGWGGGQQFNAGAFGIQTPVGG